MDKSRRGWLISIIWLMVILLASANQLFACPPPFCEACQSWDPNAGTSGECVDDDTQDESGGDTTPDDCLDCRKCSSGSCVDDDAGGNADDVCYGCKSCQSGACARDDEECEGCLGCFGLSCDVKHTNCPGECNHCKSNGDCEKFDNLCFTCQKCDDTTGNCVDDGTTCTGCKTCNDIGNCEDDNNECDASLCKICEGGDCVVECDSDACKECEEGNCVFQCDPGIPCVDGECLNCWTLEYLPSSESDDCSCTSGDCSGSYTWRQYHNCMRSTSGYTDCKEFASVEVGSEWECTESENLCGVIACAALNAAICTIQCSNAATACGAMCTGTGGSWECTEALIACGECLGGELIDCGCLTVTCEYPEVRTGPINDSDDRCYGEDTCP